MSRIELPLEYMEALQIAEAFARQQATQLGVDELTIKQWEMTRIVNVPHHDKGTTFVVCEVKFGPHIRVVVDLVFYQQGYETLPGFAFLIQRRKFDSLKDIFNSPENFYLIHRTNIVEELSKIGKGYLAELQIVRRIL